MVEVVLKLSRKKCAEAGRALRRDPLYLESQCLHTHSRQDCLGVDFQWLSCALKESGSTSSCRLQRCHQGDVDATSLYHQPWQGLLSSRSAFKHGPLRLLKGRRYRLGSIIHRARFVQKSTAFVLDRKAVGRVAWGEGSLVALHREDVENPQ
jgi:hypothetical protein